MTKKFFIEDGPSSIDLWLSLVGKVLYIYFTVGIEGGTTDSRESTVITQLGIKSYVRADPKIGKEPLPSLPLEEKILAPTITEPYIVYYIKGEFIQSTIFGKPAVTIPFEGWYDPQKRQGDIDVTQSRL